MRKLNLQLFDDPTYSVTCHKDSGITTFSASPNSSVAKGATVTLTVTPGTGKELDEIEVIAGGVTIESGEAITFKMGEANVVLYAKSKANNLYKVTENCTVYINGTKTQLTKNMTYDLNQQGVIVGVECSGTAVTVNDAVQALIDQGILIKM